MPPGILRPALALTALALALPLLPAASQEVAQPSIVPTEGYVVARDGIKIYYVIAGAGPETLVVPNGFLIAEALAPLARGRRVVFYDPRNRGRSDAGSPAEASFAANLTDLEDLRRALGIERMALLGWSGFGKEVVAYALAHPGRVTRLLQVAPVPPRQDPWLERMMESRDAKISEETWAAHTARVEAGELPDPYERCRAVGEILGPITFYDPAKAGIVPDVCDYPNEHPEALWAYFGHLVASPDPDLRPRLGELAMPRLVIHGREDDIPVEGAREWTDGQKNARLLILPESGHWPFIERPYLFFPAAEDFLAGNWPEGKG